MIGRKKVLIAEDEALIRMDLKEILEEEGYEIVGEASNGHEAVELAKRLQPNLIILDIKMPKMDGLEAAKIINEQRIAPIIILTAYSQKELVEEAVRYGAMAYLIKPFQKSSLLPAIEVAAQRFEEVEALSSETKDLHEQIETRKLIDRAKGILMDQQGLTEKEAFRRIQKASMDNRISMRKVAQTIIDKTNEA